MGRGWGWCMILPCPPHPNLARVIPDQISLTRAFWLIRHADDGRVDRLNRFATLLTAGFRAEMARLEALVTQCQQLPYRLTESPFGRSLLRTEKGRLPCSSVKS